MTPVPPGSLKCVVLPAAAELAGAMRVLAERVGEEQVIAFGGSAALVHTDEPAAVIRDWLGDIGGALVLEFEKWSGAGDAVPRDWLLARGH